MRITVADDQAGARLDHVLAEPLGSRARAQRLIDAGLVTVDGNLQPKRHRVAAGELIEIGDEPAAESPEDDGPPIEVPIAYEDDELLVVDKPAGVVVHPAAGHRTG